MKYLLIWPLFTWCPTPPWWPAWRGRRHILRSDWGGGRWPGTWEKLYVKMTWYLRKTVWKDDLIYDKTTYVTISWYLTQNSFGKWLVPCHKLFKKIPWNLPKLYLKMAWYLAQNYIKGYSCTCHETLNKMYLIPGPQFYKKKVMNLAQNIPYIDNLDLCKHQLYIEAYICFAIRHWTWRAIINCLSITDL